ncbi:putative DsbA family dithiol-disulfide isomerase [Variovorax boronicumulans]|uniref:DsbA family dithiol-disulfide isomerase n=1 Tax=Variovorax boronicumulans TaxID=436515 RepID=A0AAW8DWF2_9BURK|nr:DsbA family oxidoreductase [Variovorax boronicumulans]MDP9878534.1 putative DsbA family dithiol-disulfide isomerase [Variovorax boronicumulans]MDP9923462.1 putative DsbA family dithiol-disulfide isomerase [Variovorax boronicumulans]
MTAHLKIDFVSDVSCPWCAVGLGSLEAALKRVAPEVTAELHFQPFELNPQMPPEGQDTFEHLNQKYGSSREQQAQAREAIRQRGAAVGFEFSAGGRPRVYNTFNAHRLLHWAELEDPAKQVALKKLLLKAYFTDSQNPSDIEVLVGAATEAGLDAARAREILAGDEFAAETRERERLYTDAGIHSVPAIIINDQHLISGGQPVEVFERALRQIAGAQPSSTATA